ncbi:methyl-accepting chemotaxis protein [Pseudoduganella namucuonensis]|uniref:Methyl-accepting chemotaxis sensory transducer with TarH sensor n=1 Tax=Pseudoduganella namucuonensis TaxID=1035707 RepID=A0A1I7LZ74_9BURK|nr:methyl-accepting chemotaxis protein [Pseudoduganella namucuonensis]SFV15004.1 methyl-accepting chemotaxis sensory transducer with TarH sensor [Pseudoduganella namucuonensis]
MSTRGWWRDVSIRARLLLFSCVFTAAIMLLGAMGMYAGKQALRSMDLIYSSDARAIEMLAEIRGDMLEAVVTSRIMMDAQAGQKAALLAATQGYLGSARSGWDTYRKIPASARMAELAGRFEAAFLPSLAETTRHARAGYEGDAATVAEVEANIDPLWNAYVSATRELVAAHKELAQARYQDSVRFMDWQMLVAGAAIAGGIALAVCSHRNVVRTLLLPLEAAVRNCERIAAGDLRAQLPPAGRNEIGRLIAAFGTMQRDLSRAVSVVESGSTEIRNATREIASGTRDLSIRTERQAASLDATAANVQAIAGSARENAGSAGEALRMTERAGLVAREGGGAVDRVIGTMERIEASAGKVGEIVSVIEGIAFQTNILALNAAVEAARAGENGRGFAVVASEVRTLAQRSASAARDIGLLIRRSSAEVAAGAALAREAGATMERMLAEVTRVAGIVEHIAGASERQTADIARLNRAVEEIDGATQQNAALVEQVSAAAAVLAGQAGTLSQAVAVFQPQAQPEPAARPRLA